ncbi:MAG: hypothetical protein R3A13_12140 [Bdellovibrionota bacterium]
MKTALKTNRDRGLLLVEAAIILPIVFLLLSVIFNGKQMLDNRKEAFSAVYEGVQWIAAQKASTPAMTDATGISKAQTKVQDLLATECFNCSNITATATINPFPNPPGGRYMDITLVYDFGIFFFTIPGVAQLTFTVNGSGAYD